MRGDLTRSILEFIGEFLASQTDFLEMFLTSGRQLSMNKTMDELERRTRARKRVREYERGKAHERQKLSKLVYKLKKEGFIAEKTISNRQCYVLTERGNTKLKHLHATLEKKLPVPFYDKSASPSLIIFTFDVPESDRRKRDWLRGVLTYLDFRMLQRSVWLGKLKIPEKLVRDLGRLKMLDYVEIFEVGRTGSLKKLIS